MSGGVVVVGSANLDLTVMLERFPDPGETVLGDRLERVMGGKGVNQAVSAARTSRCAFVGCLGQDDAGELLVGHLQRGGVGTDRIQRVDQPTGHAFIQVNADGENSIVVVPLANTRVTAKLVNGALSAEMPAVVLAQLEVPLPAVEAAARWSTKHGARFLLNASPARELPPALLEACDPLIVNTAEARALIGDPAANDPAELAARLAKVAKSVVVTVGAEGAHVGTAAEGIVHVPGQPVRVADTTGAGDEFAGALAAALADGTDIVTAAQAGNRAAARVVALPRGKRHP